MIGNDKCVALEDYQKEVFWSKVAIADNNRECWEWQGARRPSGYGNVRINKKYLSAHRVAWELANFKIPGNYIIMHLCDNPACCNPAHLVLGTVLANYCDMLIKNRQEFKKNRAAGEKNGNCKLTERKVRKIRKKYPDKNQYELAAIYDVSQTTIGRILRNEIWRHLL